VGGAIGATFGAWAFFEKPSLSFMINGILAGCVSITASCAFVNIYSAFIIGFIGGIIVLFATILLEKTEIDDPVGAVPVHFCCGIWGTLAVGIFSLSPNSYTWSDLFTQGNNALKGGLLYGGGVDLLFAQIVGIIMIGSFTLIFSYLAWILIAFVSFYLSNNSTYGFRPHKGLRVTLEEETRGINELFLEYDSNEQSLEARIEELSLDYNINKQNLEARIQELERKLENKEELERKLGNQ
jgi:Amt family ammonium transporter